MTTTPSSHASPDIEIVLMVRNQVADLVATVGRLHQHLMNAAIDMWQLTIADQASSDATFAVACDLAARLPHVRVLAVADGLTNKQRRQTWAASTSTVVAFVHATASSDFAMLLAPLVGRTEAEAETVELVEAAEVVVPFRERSFSRRAVLFGLGGTGAAVILAACGANKALSSTSTSAAPATSAASTSAPATSATTTGTTATTAAAKTASSSAATTAAATASTTASAIATDVVLAPEMTQGPYYLDLNMVRSDIAEDRPGVPLALSLVVVTAAGVPVSGAAVDIWHADANGLYSGFAAASAQANGGSTGADDGTFCRGTQLSDATGKVTFNTIYPGWYQGRTVHIHVLIHVSGKSVHTGQLFFDDTFTDGVYASNKPYSTRGTRTTKNSNDGIYSGGGSKSIVPVTKSGSGYAGTLVTGVKV
jgi:protocatechuate 3,4-dioxygenase beta subunit